MTPKRINYPGHTLVRGLKTNRHVDIHDAFVRDGWSHELRGYSTKNDIHSYRKGRYSTTVMVERATGVVLSWLHKHHRSTY